MIERLRSHYGFTRTPFGRDLAPGMLFKHTAHAEAAARLTWCITEKAIGMVTGEVGVGKTVALRAALGTLDPARYSIIYIADPEIGMRGILTQLIVALGGNPKPHLATLIPQAADILAGEHAERGRTPVLILDEAHLLNHAQLDALRMMTNHDLDSRQPFALLLLGQPTLRRMIKLGVLAALDQRISVRYPMGGMTAEETSGYIHHHLQLAGRSDPLFSDDAITLIHESARGKPRTVNNLAIQALLASFAAGKAIVDESAARSAVTEVISPE
ncbi:ExeA family protein [Nonomuraea polychroma]|uniref:ExeA family protein n=1 Tax=Nonomuraea polychroma TaxID=46176 RepID=UPI003D8A766B